MPVALLIGVGGGVGRATIATFAAAGYKVAVASRTERFDSSKYPFFKFDAAGPTQLPEVFEKVHKEVGIPSVVLYNGMKLHFPPRVLYPSSGVMRKSLKGGPSAPNFETWSACNFGTLIR